MTATTGVLFWLTTKSMFKTFKIVLMNLLANKCLTKEIDPIKYLVIWNQTIISWDKIDSGQTKIMYNFTLVLQSTI